MSTPAQAAHRRHRYALILLWVIPAVWSSNYLIARAAAPLVPPHTLALGRWAIVGGVLLAFSAGTLLASPRRVLDEAWRCLALGALGMYICGAWVYIAGRTSPATNIALIYAVAPVGIALVSRRLLGEHLDRAQRIGMAMALAGVVFVIAKGDPRALLALDFTAGDGWIAAAMVAWVAYSVLLNLWRTRLSAFERLACMALGGCAILLPFAVYEWTTMTAPLGAKGWGLIGLAALLPGLVSYLAHGFIQRELGAARTALMLYVAPIYGALLAWWLLDEPPRWYHLVGAALILPSIHFATRGSSRGGAAAAAQPRD